MRKIWKRSDVDENKEYVVLLCDDGQGDRYYELCEISQITEKSLNPDCVFVTEVVPIQLILNGNVGGISETVKLTNGDPFYCEAHGIWLSKQESDDWDHDDGSLSSIRWERGCIPNFPPR